VGEFSVGQLVELLLRHTLPADTPLEVLRREHDRAVAKAPVAPGVAVSTSMSSGGLIEWLVPPAAGPEVLLWLHGGGFGLGSSVTARGMVSTLSARSGVRGASLNYRLAPEYPYPAGVEDAQAAYMWLLEQGVLPSQVVIAGDSAGGGLALAALVRIRDGGGPMPAGALCFSPWVDLSLSEISRDSPNDPQVTRDGLQTWARRYLNGIDPRSPGASPLFANLAGLPPLLIQVGGAETLREDSVRFARAASFAGCEVVIDEWPDMIHVWQAFAPGLARGTAALDSAAQWVRSRIADEADGLG
jgi:monoterpene epsilon-lactone hydrolase